MQLIGTVARLQIQVSSLKIGVSPRRYDPSPLHAVSTMEITPAGVVALDEDGTRTIDVHNQDHPASKNVRGINGVSLGFTSHYAAMCERFGSHLTDGIAGENILIETDRSFAEPDLADGLIIAGGNGQRVTLAQIVVAAPCVEFTRFALRFPDDARPDKSVTDCLQFLHNGRRGFYATYSGAPQTIRRGDRVYLP
jgi:hypothetical protein